MARIEGIDLPRNKRIEFGLTYIYGIGLSRSHEILNYTDVSPDTRVKDLTLAGLRSGQWRDLTKGEIAMLKG